MDDDLAPAGYTDLLSDLKRRIGAARNPQSDRATELVKSEYNFDFLGVGTEAHERIIENGLIDHVRTFLLELGSGFARCRP